MHFRQSDTRPFFSTISHVLATLQADEVMEVVIGFGRCLQKKVCGQTAGLL
jgi:hypothetical protein